MSHLTMMLTLTLFSLIYAVYLISEMLSALPQNTAEVTDEQGNLQDTMLFLLITNRFKYELRISMLLLVASFVWILIYFLTRLGT